MSNWSDEETDEPLIADHRNFYKVEKWSRRRPAGDWVAVRGQQLGQGQTRLRSLGKASAAQTSIWRL